MIQEVAHLNVEDRELVMDAPIWISLYAAYRHDGQMDAEEREEAIKQVHYRSYSGTKRLQHYFDAIDDGFQLRFDASDTALSKNPVERDSFLANKIQDCIRAINNLESKSFARKLLHDLDSYYAYVFNSTSNFFQYFAFPIISNELQKALEDDLGGV
jgi:hypothetical protein